MMSTPVPVEVEELGRTLGVVCLLWRRWWDAATIAVAVPHFPRFGVVAPGLRSLRLWWCGGNYHQAVHTAGVNRQWDVISGALTPLE